MTQGSTLNIWHVGRWPPSDGRRPSAMEDDKLNKWVLSLKRTSHFGGWRNRLPFSPRTIEFSAYTNKTWALEHNISQWHQLYCLELFQADWLHHVTSLVLKNVQGPCSLGHIIMLYKFSFHLYAENSMVRGENWNSCLTHWKMTSKWWKTTFSHGRWQELQFSPRTIEFSEYTWKEKHNISQWHQLYRSNCSRQAGYIM